MHRVSARAGWYQVKHGQHQRGCGKPSLIFYITKGVPVIHYAKHPAPGIYCGRGRGRTNLLSGLPPGTFGWLGNPYNDQIYGRERCIRLYKRDFYIMLKSDKRFREAMEAIRKRHREGQIVTLICWCKSVDVCHTRIIKKWLEK